MAMVDEMGYPSAYDHFAEGESPEPPFIVFLYPKANNFAADGKVYYKINRLNIELYTDLKDVELERKWKPCLIRTVFFMPKAKYGLSLNVCMRCFMKWRYRDGK